VDDEAKTYLERELDLRQANQIMLSDVHVWYWEVRFFKPQQEEEFRVRVSPQDRLWLRPQNEESRAGPSLDRAAQNRRANLSDSKLGMDLKAWTFFPRSQFEEKANRLDWEFTWENTISRERRAVRLQ